MKTVNLGKGYEMVWQKSPKHQTVRVVVKKEGKIVARGPAVPEALADSSMGYVLGSLRTLLKQQGETLPEEDPEAPWTDESDGVFRCHWCDHVYGSFDYLTILRHCMEKHPLFYREKYIREVLPSGQFIAKEFVPLGLPAPMKLYDPETIDTNPQ